MDIKNHNFRFNVEKEMDKKAWDIVHSDEVSNEFKSQNEFVIRAIIDFYEKYIRMKEDPYFESREKEDEFINRIVVAVEQKVLSNIPALTGMYLSLMQGAMPGVSLGAGMTGTAPIMGGIMSGAMPVGMFTAGNMPEESDDLMDDEEEDNELLNLNLFGED